MIPQVATTASVIGTGPRWNSGGAGRAASSWRDGSQPRMTASARQQTPSAVSSSGIAPCAARPASARQPSSDEAAEHQHQRRAMAPPRSANRRAFHHRPTEIQRRRRRCRRRNRRHRIGDGIVAHALCIHRQADQQPSTSAEHSSGAVQNRPELKCGRASGRRTRRAASA